MRLESIHTGQILNKKLIGQYDSISIYRVNGEQVRALGGKFAEFNESASYLVIPEIPRNEGWIEDGVPPNELSAVIAGLLAGMRSGDYDGGEDVERWKRTKTLPASKIRQKCLGTLFGIAFWLVDAKAVRDRYKVDFASGGNNGPYKWIPYDEIWLDANLHPDELPTVALHEFVERFKMLRDGLTYDQAHAVAQHTEWLARERRELPDVLSKLVIFITRATQSQKIGEDSIF